MLTIQDKVMVAFYFNWLSPNSFVGDLFLQPSNSFSAKAFDVFQLRYRNELDLIAKPTFDESFRLFIIFDRIKRHRCFRFESSFDAGQLTQMIHPRCEIVLVETAFEVLRS